MKPRPARAYRAARRNRMWRRRPVGNTNRAVHFPAYLNKTISHVAIPSIAPVNSPAAAPMRASGDQPANQRLMRGG